MPVRPPQFRPSHARAARSVPRQQHDERRGSARERGYTTAWDKAAKTFLSSHPLCLGCSAIGRVVPSALVDHVEPHRGDMAKFWDAEMWQPSCRWHHDVVKKHLEGRFDQGALVVADLWLDSRAAQAATIHLIPDREGLDEA